VKQELDSATTKAQSGDKKLSLENAAKVFLVIAVLAAVMVRHYEQFTGAFGPSSDFPALYAAGKMVWNGDGHTLYDFQQQNRYQQKYTSRIGENFVSPPITAFLYAPLSSLSLEHAYLAALFVNMIALVLSSRILCRTILSRVEANFLLLAMLAFMPTHFALAHAQVSIVVLLIYAMVFAALKSNLEFAAGCILALGNIKPQLVLPFFAVLLFRRQWRFVGGFVAGSAFLFVISIAMIGTSFPSQYLALLANFGQPAIAAVVNPRMMANARGLSAIVAGNSNFLRGIIMVLVSGVAAYATWRTLKNKTYIDAAGFGALVSFTILLSFHFNPHDLVLLLIPLCTALPYLMDSQHRWRWGIIYLLCLLVPVHNFLGGNHLYGLFSILVLAMLIGTAREKDTRSLTTAPMRV
jgi:hypothetical protein